MEVLYSALASLGLVGGQQLACVFQTKLFL